MPRINLVVAGVLSIIVMMSRSLKYTATLLLGILLGYLFAKSDNAPTPALEYRSLVQSSRAPLLSSSSNADTSKGSLDEGVGDQSDRSNLSVPISALKSAFKNMGLSGIYLDEGFLQFESTLVEILEITDVERAKLKEPFSSVLSRVRESQVHAAEVVSHDPMGESVIKVGAASEEQAQLWQEEIHAASLSVLGNKRGGQFCEIISDVLLHSLAYSAMAITVSPSSGYDGNHFKFVVASEDGITTSQSESTPERIAHLIDLSDFSER